jgi:hypothetical protein
MIRPLAFRRSALNAIALPTDSCGEFRKTENPCFPRIAGPNRIRARNPAASESNEKASTDSDKLGGFLSGYEWFGHHDNSSDLQHVSLADKGWGNEPAPASILCDDFSRVQDFAPIALLVLSIANTEDAEASGYLEVPD